MHRKKILICLILGSLLWTAPGFSYDARPACFKSLEVNFFDITYLYQALNLYNIPQGSWNLILTALHQQSLSVPAIMMKEGKKLAKNPLENPFNPEEAEKLLLRVLYGVFYDALHNNAVIDDPSIEKMFAYIVRHKQPLLNACFQKVEEQQYLRRPLNLDNMSQK